MHGEIEQLWYTWSAVGLGNTNGFQVRAASRNLQDMQNERFRSLDRYLRYSLPQGTDPYTLRPEEAPVCLAFIDAGSEHVVLHKEFTGRDQFGRSGNFFTHLLAGLPLDFTAQEAIQLWQWSGWQATDTLEPYQLELPTLTSDRLMSQGWQQQINTTDRYLKDFLALVIQSYLELGEQQHLYIAAPPETIATFVWALTNCLPRHFLHDLTFSTYEYDVLKATTRIVGTCWLNNKNSMQGETDGTQPDLPQECYQGRHKAINCFKDKPALSAQNTLEAHFALAASQSFMAQDARYLKTFIKRMEQVDPASLDMRSFLISYNVFTDEIQHKKVFAEDLNLMLANPGLASHYLEQERIRQALLEAGVKNQTWATERGWEALRNLNTLTLDGTYPALQKTLKAVVKMAAPELQKLVDKQDIQAIWYLLQLCESALPPAQDTKTWSIFLEILTTEQNNLLVVYPWSIRSWVLQNFSFVRDEKRLAPWLTIQWKELDAYLTLQLSPRWTQATLALLFNSSTTIPETAIPILEKHTPLIEKLLKETLTSQKLRAINYFEKLITAGYQNKQRLLEIITPRLTADEAATEALLIAARLNEQERIDLLESTALQLLSYQKLPATLNQYIERYLQIFNVEKLRNPQIVHMLNALQQTALSPLALQLVQAWLSIAIFVQQPGTQEHEITRLTQSISQLPATNYNAITSFLVPFMSVYISDENNLINVITNMESVLQQNRQQLLHLFVRVAGEDYAKLRSVKHLSIFSSVILDLAALNDEESENYHNTAYSRRLLQDLLQHADKNTLQEMNISAEEWSANKQEQWYSLTSRLQAAKKVKARKNTQNSHSPRLTQKQDTDTSEPKNQSLPQKLLQWFIQSRSE